MAAVAAFGAEFWLDNASGTLTKIGNPLVIPPPAVTRESIDATDHDSEDGVAEYIASGVLRIGSMSVTLHRDPLSASDALIMEAITSGTRRTFKVIENKTGGTSETTGECFVTGYEPDGDEIEGKKTATLTIQPTGPITQEAGS